MLKVKSRKYYILDSARQVLLGQPANDLICHQNKWIQLGNHTVGCIVLNRKFVGNMKSCISWKSLLLQQHYIDDNTACVSGRLKHHCFYSVSGCSRDDLHRIRVPDDVSPEVRVQRSRLQLPAGRRHRPVGPHLQRCTTAESAAPYHTCHLGQVHNTTNHCLLGGILDHIFKAQNDDRSHIKILAKA